jgi:hypothetical protein
MARMKKLDVLVREALQSLLHAYRDGRLTEGEYAYRIGLVEGWLRARGYLHAGNPPLFDPRFLWRPGQSPSPPIVARLPSR